MGGDAETLAFYTREAEAYAEFAGGHTVPAVMRDFAGMLPTGARVLASAGAEVELSGEQTVLTLTGDRCSNGPHLYYPNPGGPGGTGAHANIVACGLGTSHPAPASPSINTSRRSR